jgi:hypothetical protein
MLPEAPCGTRDYVEGERKKQATGNAARATLSRFGESPAATQLYR